MVSQDLERNPESHFEKEIEFDEEWLAVAGILIAMVMPGRVGLGTVLVINSLCLSP